MKFKPAQGKDKIILLNTQKSAYVLDKPKQEVTQGATPQYYCVSLRCSFFVQILHDFYGFRFTSGAGKRSSRDCWSHRADDGQYPVSFGFLVGGPASFRIAESES